MDFEIQRAPLLRRLAAFLIDILLRGILIVALLSLFASVTRFEEKKQRMETIYDEIAERFGISPNDVIDSSALPPDEQERYRLANEALAADEEAGSLYRWLIISYVAGVSGAILITYLLLEFAVPLLFRDGRTVGKRLFGLCVVHTNCVRMEAGAMFIRSFFGKYIVETMISVLGIILLNMGAVGSAALMLPILLLLFEAVLFFAGKNRQLIHDYFAQSAVADYQSQPIYDTLDELNKAKGKKTAKAAKMSR